MSNAPHILVVDDDAKIRRLLRRCFEDEGWQVSEAGSGAEAAGFDPELFDLITLDLTLGDQNGLEVARDIRSRCETPIVMVTGKGETIDAVVGLEIGADDYIAKPFHLREVVARVRSVLRRSASRDRSSADQKACADRYRFAGWEADFDRLELVSSEGAPCDLTGGELKLLEIFVKHPNRVLSRDQIMDLLRGHDCSPYDRSIDNQVARLRKKIEPDPLSPQLIKTIRGSGYKFVATISRGGGT